MYVIAFGYGEGVAGVSKNWEGMQNRIAQAIGKRLEIQTGLAQLHTRGLCRCTLQQPMYYIAYFSQKHRDRKMYVDLA